MRLLIRLPLLFLLLTPTGLFAQDTGQDTAALAIKHTDNFDISGDGTADEWRTTQWITLERRKGVATYSTRAKLLYSDSGIYGLFSCEDKKITSTLKEDFDDLWTEDVVEIFFWTDETVPLYFEYELSPTNRELAILVPNMEGDFFGWRPWQFEGQRKTRHATKIMKDPNGNPTEWRAEFFIPYALLKPLRNVPPMKGSEWRINMYRIDHDEENTSWTWKPVQTNFHDYERFGLIRFD